MPTVEIENINHPGKLRRVDQDKYLALRTCYLAALSTAAPGLTIAEIHARLLPLLPATEFPNGEKAGWWAKCVQLDLEAKGLVVRSKGSPVRLRCV